MKDIEKLPTWAQRRILKLEADVEHWREQALAVMPRPSSGRRRWTNVRLVVYGSRDSEHLLPPYSTIEYDHGASNELRSHKIAMPAGTVVVRPASRQNPDGWLSVSARDGNLIVMPRASNVVLVRSVS